MGARRHVSTMDPTISHPDSVGRMSEDPDDARVSPSEAAAPTKPQADGEEAPDLDEEGRFRARGTLSYAVVGTYVFLLLFFVYLSRSSFFGTFGWTPYLLLAVTAVFLARYLSTTYTIDDTRLRAWRVLGGRSVPLEEVRAIEYASMRDLVPIGGGLTMGSWGWRGHLYSPSIGEFDSIYTDPVRGLLVTAGAYPLYISPKDPEGFARELSRRVRSYTGPLSKDVGSPGPGRPAQ